MEKNKARVLLFDIESSPNLGYAYGKWQTNLIKIMQYSHIMSFSWKWLGDKKVQHKSVVDIVYPDGQTAGEALIRKLHDLFEEADVVIAHNAYGFDIKVANAAFMQYNLAPPSPYKVVDTLRVARSQFKFPGGNSLNELGKFMGVGTKSETGVGDLWFKCLQGDLASWRKLKVYNDQDVVVLEGIYNKMLPYIKNHPNVGDILQRDGVCPKCGSASLQRRGFNNRRNGKTQRYQCNECHGWCNEANLRRKGRTVNA